MPNIIGTAPNQVPTNADLGSMAYQDSDAVKVKDITFNDWSTQQTAATGFGFKNRIINGAMMIDQRNAGASVTPANTQYLVDRFFYGATQASKMLAQQNFASVTPPNGFTNYLGLQTAAAYSVTSTDTFYISQKIEGYNIADLNWGSANAAAVTLSFWVYSSLTGTFGGALLNSSTRSYPFSFTVSAANTWTQISITIAGDTSGTWNTTNGTGIIVRFGLGSGSTYTGTAGSWSSSNLVQPTGSVSVVGTLNATFLITGVQLEKGSTATSFDYRPYGTELVLCQRYYENNYNGQAVGSYVTGGSIYAYNVTITPSNGHAVVGIPFKVTKRASPTTTVYSYTGSINQWHYGKAGQSETLFTAGTVYSQPYTTYFTTSGIPTDQNTMYGMFSASAEL